MKRRPPIAIIIVLIVALAAAAIYFIYNATRPTVASTVLTASGTVETTGIAISPEMAGKVLSVKVSQGDEVRQGDVLFILDGSLLQAQRNAALAALATAKSSVATANAAFATANAAVDSAQAQYDLALAAALNEEKAARTTDWPTNSAPSDFTQPSWYFDKTEQIAGVQAELDQAKTGMDKAVAQVKTFEQKSSASNFMDIEKRLTTARVRFKVAKQILDGTTDASQELRDAAQTAYDDAKSELDAAQKAYDEAIIAAGAMDVLQARAKLRIAQERYDAAMDQLRALKTGALSPKVTAAQKVLDQVKAGSDQAKAAADQTTQTIQQAEANIALIDAQITKLTVTAPEDAVVIKRNIEPGEVVNPGSVILNLGRKADLTITVYIPEDRYGEIKLGQNAIVKADSFPTLTFNATVMYIADKAEFTPRNVQTVEGRKSTVFAIKLKVDDPNTQLKAGMPADVTFK